MIKRIPQVARDDLTRNMLLFSLLERGIFTSTASNLILSQGNRATHSTMFHIRHLQGEPHRLNKDRRCALHQQETKDGDSSIQRRRIRKQSLHSSTLSRRIATSSTSSAGNYALYHYRRVRQANQKRFDDLFDIGNRRGFRNARCQVVYADHKEYNIWAAIRYGIQTIEHLEHRSIPY